MTERSRWAFPRLARVAAAWVAAVVLGAGVLMAQGTTGKIEGTVRDQSGAAVNGAQVFIVGTTFAAVSNEHGYYFINNVPAGMYTIRAQYIGYAPAEVRQVRVFAGQTMTINVPLEARAIEVSGVTVTVEQTPIVPRDQVTSKPIVGGEVVAALPVDAVSQVLNLQPGVVAGRTGTTIRGGRPGEAATYIDGVLVRSMTGNTGSISVGTNALEEMSVTTGAIGAEYGDAQSGVISYVTRAGGQRLRGNLAFGSSEPAGQTYGEGLNRLEASLSGPVPGIRNLTFFLGTTIQGQQNGRQSKDLQDGTYFIRDGIDTTMTIARSPGDPTSDSQVVNVPKFVSYSSGTRRFMSWSSNYGIDGKLQYTFGTGSRVSFTFHQTGNENLGAGGINAQAASAGWGLASAYILNWTQNLAQSTERALFLDATFSYQHEQNIGGAIDPQWATEHASPFGWFSASKPNFLINFDNWSIDDRLIQNVRLGNCSQGRDAARPNLGGCVPFNGRTDLVSSADDFRFNPYGVTASYFSNQGFSGNAPGLAEESRITGRVNFDWQANRYNRVRFGGDFVKSNLKRWSANNWTNTIFMDAYIEHPLRYGLYASDRIDLGDVVVDLGLRYDRLDSKIQYPRAPGVNYTDPIRTGSLAQPADWPAPTAEDTAMAQRCGALYAKVTSAAATSADTTAWSTCNYFTAKPRSALAPSIRVSFPVTDRTGFRLSYSHQLQTPTFNLLATSHNIDLAMTNANTNYSRDLDYGKTIMFEFGIRHAFSDDMVLDISAYNKDKVSDVTGRLFLLNNPFSAKTQQVGLYTNADFGNVRGVDIKLDRRIGSLFQGTLVYTFQTTLTTGSNPTEYLNTTARQLSNVTGDRAPAPQALLPSSENRTHTITGNLSLNFPHGWHSGSTVGTILQDFGFNATFRFASGLPYTPVFNNGDGVFGPGNGFGNVFLGTERLNSATMPWIKNVDLRVTRGFRVAGKDLTVFADFRNLFNWTNWQNIMAETGDVVNAVYQQKQLDPIRNSLILEAGPLYQTQDVTKNGVTTRMPVVDLTDCTAYNPSKWSGPVNCYMLRRTEERFGNGDHIFDQNEINAALNAYYGTYNAPWTNYGVGLNIRFGFELNF